MRSEKDKQAGARAIEHRFGFDPTYAMDLPELLQIRAPDGPPDFASFWRSRFEAVVGHKPLAVLRDTGHDRGRWRVHDWSYTSTRKTEIRGWALLPQSGEVKRGFLVTHGYGGRGAPDSDLDFEDAALFFPCLRGLGRSWNPFISGESRWHVLHDIQSRNRYVVGGCVEDVWVGISAMLRLFPQIQGHIGYLGISFGGGVGLLAAAWDQRIARLHVNLPTFGNQPLRLKLPTVGSAASVQRFVERCPKAVEVLKYYDAATAARHVTIPTHCACALFDPSVAPPGQFSIFNALAGPKQLTLLTAGHQVYVGEAEEFLELRQNLYNFFRDI